MIRIRRAAVRTKARYTVTTPKSDAGVRDVAIPPHIIPAHRGRISRNTLIRAVIRWCSPPTTAGIYNPRRCTGTGTGHATRWPPDLRWHDLATFGAVLAAATGASLAELMARLGHSTPQAAMRYQHAAQGRDREIAALLSKLAANEAATP